MTLFARRSMILFSLLLVGVAVAGCGAHRVQGVVVAGRSSYVQVLDKDSPVFDEGERLAGARIEGIVDPRSLNSTRLESVMTDASGGFSLPVDVFGAGVLEYELGLRGVRSGFTSAEGFFPIPSGSQRVLIVLAPGSDPNDAFRTGFDEGYDYRRDLERFAH